LHAEQAERGPTLHDDLHELFRVVGRLRWRLGLEQIFLFVLRALMLSAISLALLSLTAWLAGAPDVLTRYAWLPGVPVAIAVLVALLRWPSDRQAALVADRRLVLHERLATAVEIAARPSGRFDRAQIHDALETALALPGGALPVDRRLRRAGLLAAALLVVATASSLLINVPRPGVLAPDENSVLSDAAPSSDLVDRSTPEATEGLALPGDTQPIVQTQPDANLAARVQQEQAENDALDRLSQALDRVSAAQPAADSIRQGNFSQARDQLTSLGQEADQLSDAAKQQLSRALQQASTQTAATDRQLADRERQAGQALGRPNYNEQRQALSALADQVERSGEHAAPADQLARDAGLLQQQSASKNQAQQASTQSQGNSSQRPSAASDGVPASVQQAGASGGQQGNGADGQQGGPGVGNGVNPDVLGDPSRLDSAGQSVEVPTKLGSGPGVRPSTGAEDQTGTDPSSGARSVSELVQAQQTGQVTPEQNLVPGEQRPVVRGYFR
jgi:hypothetical protein